MNILFFTQEDPFYVKVFFDEFFSIYPSLEEIKAFVISRPMGKNSILKLARQMYDFYGLLDFIRVGSRYAYKKTMGKRAVRRATPTSPPKTHTVRQLAEAYRLKVLERSDLNSPDFHQTIRQYEPDLFISVASPIIFKQALISIPKIATINIHTAPLPKYRGMLPNFWQIYHNEKEAGLTVHKIDTGIDTGDMLKQQYVPIGKDDSLHDMILKTKKKGAKLIKEVIEDFKAGKINPTPITGDGSYFSFPSREDVLEYKRRGKKLL